MNGVSSATDFGTLNTVLYNAGLAARSLNTLTAQASSGLLSSQYDGLGGGARTALDLSGQLALNTGSQANAAQAANVNQVTQTALGQIQGLVAGMTSQLLEPSVQTNSGLSTLAASARTMLIQVAGLLDTKVGQIYVFAGKDSRSPPIPDPASMSSSAFSTAIQAAVAGLTVAGAATVQSQLLTAAAPGATSPFSATLEASNQLASADLGSGQTVQLGVLADQNTDAVSAGIGLTSTGSYMRDTLMALSTIGSLGTANATDPQVQALLGMVHTTLSGADDAMNVDIGGLGARQKTTTDTQTELSDTAAALTTQLGAVQDADPAQVATALSAVQIQIQASYKIIASLEQLSLAKFI